jgi:hypothetical protein
MRRSTQTRSQHPRSAKRANPPPVRLRVWSAEVDDEFRVNAKFKFLEYQRPPCSRCGRPLVLTRIEPWDPGFDLRIYYCAHCADTETIISPI